MWPDDRDLVLSAIRKNLLVSLNLNNVGIGCECKQQSANAMHEKSCAENECGDIQEISEALASNQSVRSLILDHNAMHKAKKEGGGFYLRVMATALGTIKHDLEELHMDYCLFGLKRKVVTSERHVVSTLIQIWATKGNRKCILLVRRPINRSV